MCNNSDPFGLWPAAVHDKFIESALGKTKDAAMIKSDSRRFDMLTQFNRQAPWHAMRAPAQSVADAKAQTKQFIAGMMGAAITLESSGHHEDAMNALAKAMHAEMDKTSPAHRDANGDPLPWDLYSPSGVSAHMKLDESSQPSQREIQDMDAKLMAMYNHVMAAKNDKP